MNAEAVDLATVKDEDVDEAKADDEEKDEGGGAYGDEGQRRPPGETERPTIGLLDLVLEDVAIMATGDGKDC